jgi:hypothetical protein
MKKRPKQDTVLMPQAVEPSNIQIPFTSGDEEWAYLTIKNNGSELEYPVAQVGKAELYEIGPTPHIWTSYPRALTRGVQKNLFTTTRMRLFILLGILLLAIARRARALVILLAIPAYYLCVQSILHTEIRYILAMHYFLFIIAAVTLYCSVLAVRIAVSRKMRQIMHSSTSPIR